MNLEAGPEIAILGLGNLLRTDDGLGVHAIRRLAESGRVPPGIQVIEGGTMGLDLLPRMEGLSHLLAIDAVEFGAPPGTLFRFANGDLGTIPTGKSVHLLGFSDLLGALRLLGRGPREVVLLGLQPESTVWGVTLSPKVAAALDDLLEVALAEVALWPDATPTRLTLHRDAHHS